jgi:hypothetical protein
MSPQGDGESRGPGRLSLPRRIGRAAFAPFRSLRIGESIAALRQDFADLRAGDRRAEASRVKLDETGAFDRDAMAFLQGQPRASFEDRLATRHKERGGAGKRRPFGVGAEESRRQNVPGGRSCDPPPAPVAHSALS